MTRDRSYGKDPTIVTRTMNFNLPVRKLRNGPYKGLYKIPSGSVIHTCFTSDFFHPAADTWREEAWEAMRIRSDCTFFMITKRPERIASCLPLSFFSTSSTFSSNGRSQSDEWSHISIAVTCEDQRQINRRLPVYLELPLQEHIVVIEPMLGAINLKPFLSAPSNTSSTAAFPESSSMVDELSSSTNEHGAAIDELRKDRIDRVIVGGESGPHARICDYRWVLGVQMQCVEYGVPFTYHQTGARLVKGGREYRIPRDLQEVQAKKAGLDFDGVKMVSWSMPIP